MNSSDYFNWASRHARRRRARPEDLEETAELAAPSEPIGVQEFNGTSTTVIERIRDALRKRLRGET